MRIDYRELQRRQQIILAYHQKGNRLRKLNSMDLLVLFTAVVIPSLPGTFFSDVNVPQLAARLVVLFYATEVAFQRGIGGHRTYSAAVFASLATMAARAMM